MGQALFIFVGVPVLYTVYFFGRCYLVDKQPIFSRRNAVPVATIIARHAVIWFLVIALARAEFRIYPLLPGWLMAGSVPDFMGKAFSAFFVFCLALVVAIAELEKRWIYVDSGVDGSDSNRSSL